MKFKLASKFKPAGDQPQAIEKLAAGLSRGLRYQTLLGVTGSGKTFTVANIIEQIQKPTLVIAHNKTLAAQLAQEYRDFFPDNAVHYFVSYYDYYQPEAYMPITDTYIEKEAQINAEIDRLRHASTQALLTRRDVIIVASVSCIYGLGSPEEYEKVHLKISVGDKKDRGTLIREMVAIYFRRTNADLTPGKFRAVGNTIEIMPVNEVAIYRISLGENTIQQLEKINSLTRVIQSKEKIFFLFPAKHYVTPKEKQDRAVAQIKLELDGQLKKLNREEKILEAERLKRRTNYDLAIIREIGYCNGIENYSRHFDGRSPGEPPFTLLSYFPQTKNNGPDFLTIIDESHVTVPQLRGMFAGDRSRKETLIEHGFRLPSAKDNRPLTFDEFEGRTRQTIYTSATPGEYEKEKSSQIIEQVIRPTGLVDPKVLIRPITSRGSSPGGSTPIMEVEPPFEGQIKDFIKEAEKVIAGGGRVIATTLTKKMAEDLSEYLKERNIKAEYLHSDIETLERIKILTEFRKGAGRGGFDCLVGVNLLREGLDLPEVELIGILDADKEGFLRSETSLIQTIGRAARNVLGKVILYADQMTGSIEKAVGETNRRRTLQITHNKKHRITPLTIKKKIEDITETLQGKQKKAVTMLLSIDKASVQNNGELKNLIKEKGRQMSKAVKELDFESAAIIRDEILALKNIANRNQKKKWRDEVPQ